MPLKPIEYRDASPAVRAVFDDIKTSRKIEDVNNFWKYLAHDPVTLKRTWDSVKEVMAPGALDSLIKEMIYLAVSVSNGCGYCIASHTAAARKAGMTDAMFGEVMASGSRITCGACSRCAILAGRFYAFNAGFQRHRHCGCQHVPSGRGTARRLIYFNNILKLPVRAPIQATTDEPPGGRMGG